MDVRIMGLQDLAGDRCSDQVSTTDIERRCERELAADSYGLDHARACSLRAMRF